MMYVTIYANLSTRTSFISRSINTTITITQLIGSTSIKLFNIILEDSIIDN